MDTVKRLRGPSADAGNAYAGDLLDRKELGNNLTRLIKAVDTPTTIALDGSWGSGKTTFLRMWSRDLVDTESSIPVVSFNAWEHDYASDPLIALATELADNIEGQKDIGRTVKKGLLAAANNLVSTIALATVNVGLTAVTGGVVTTDTLCDAANAGIDAAQKPSEPLAGALRDCVNQYRESKKAVQNFKDKLAEYGQAARGVDAIQSTDMDTASSPPMVIVIDELDRCRPTWAIEMLERIKHLFDVPGIVFVLGVDRRQLAESVRAVYGSGFDGSTYLRRFFDYCIPVEIPQDGNKKYIQELCRHYMDNRWGLGAVISMLNQKHQLDLRTLQQLFDLCQIVINACHGHEDFVRVDRTELAMSCCIIACVTQLNPKLAYRLRRREANTEELLDFLVPSNMDDPKIASAWHGHNSQSHQIGPLQRAAHRLGDVGYADRIIEKKGLLVQTTQGAYEARQTLADEYRAYSIEALDMMFSIAAMGVRNWE